MAPIAHLRLRHSQLCQEPPADTRTPLMRRLDIIQAMSERPRICAVSSEPRDWKKWRKAENGYLKSRCHMCKGTGVITVDDGYGGVDFDACPRCTPGSTRTGYPTKNTEQETF